MKCDYCICKTCRIARFNGGIDDCGNCEKCFYDENIGITTACLEYYNPKPHPLTILKKSGIIINERGEKE